MKKRLGVLCAAGWFVTNAMATVFVDVENYVRPSSPLGFQVKQGVPLTGTFNLLDSGYDPTTEQLFGAVATFALWDPKLGQENLSISLGSSASTIWSGSIAFAVAVPGAVNGAALWDLGADGILGFTVNSTKGEAYVAAATLVANGGTRVPDGGATLILLGLAFIGILAIHRKSVLAS